MSIQLNYESKPNIASAMFKALVLPRKGFDAKVGLPNIQATWTGAKADKDALADYLNVLGLPQQDTLPILYPHVMAGAMHMHMLANKAFPIRLLGALHLKNRITQLKTIAVDGVFDIKSAMADFRLVAKGVEFDFTTDVYAKNESGELEKVWFEVSTYFMAGRFGGKENPSTETSFELAALENPVAGKDWFVPANRGKVYAKITGDYNPIHTSKQLAKLFGFKRDIAHGFGVLAQGIETVVAIETAGGLDKALQVDVIFKGPVFLENTVTLKQNTGQDAQRFDMYCGKNEKPNICAAVLAV